MNITPSTTLRQLAAEAHNRGTKVRIDFRRISMAREETKAVLLARLEEKEIQVRNLQDQVADLQGEAREHRKQRHADGTALERTYTALQRLYGFVCAGLGGKANHTVEAWMAQSRGETYYNPENDTCR